MSKFEDSIFKVGDKVLLSPESRWVGSKSYQPNSTNPTGVVGEIIKEYDYAHEEDSSFHWCVDWVNGTTNTYHSEDLILVDDIVENTTDENLHSIIEEQAAHITNLEGALEMVQKELIELREKLEVQGDVDTKGTDEQFKPISEYTIEDWELALSEGWEFMTRGGNVEHVTFINDCDTYYPISFGNYEVTLCGHYWQSKYPEVEDIIKRIK